MQQNSFNFNPDLSTCSTVSLLTYGIQYKLKLINGNKPEKRESLVQMDKDQRFYRVKSRLNFMIKAAVM